MYSLSHLSWYIQLPHNPHKLFIGYCVVCLWKTQTISVSGFVIINPPNLFTSFKTLIGLCGSKRAKSGLKLIRKQGMTGSITTEGAVFWKRARMTSWINMRFTTEFRGLMVFWLATSIWVAVLSDLLGRVLLNFLKRVSQFLAIQGKVLYYHGDFSLTILVMLYLLTYIMFSLNFD